MRHAWFGSAHAGGAIKQGVHHSSSEAKKKKDRPGARARCEWKILHAHDMYMLCMWKGGCFDTAVRPVDSASRRVHAHVHVDRGRRGGLWGEVLRDAKYSLSMAINFELHDKMSGLAGATSCSSLGAGLHERFIVVLPFAFVSKATLSASRMANRCVAP